MPLPAVRCRPEQAGDKTVRTDCVCSGAHCAAVGGFAALRMRRALAGSDRLAGWQYLRYVFYGVRPPSLSFRGAKRCGNLAGPGWITGKFRQNRDCLPEIATGAKRPRNDKSGGLAPLNLCRNHCQTAWRSLSAATVKPGGVYGRRCLSHSGSAFPRLPRPRWGLAMTNLGALRRRMRAAKIASLHGAH